MDELNKLVGIIDTLLGPEGCPWDKKQTLRGMRQQVIEEAYELVEAIDLDNNAHIVEEIGDLFLDLVLTARIAEKEGKGSMQHILEQINEKLIRRHPHVFGDADVKDADAVLKQWNEIKAKEKPSRKKILDGVPKDLPALARAQKVIDKLDISDDDQIFHDEQELGEALLKIVAAAKRSNLDAESALRKSVSLMLC